MFVVYTVPEIASQASESWGIFHFASPVCSLHSRTVKLFITCNLHSVIYEGVLQLLGIHVAYLFLFQVN